MKRTWMQLIEEQAPTLKAQARLEESSMVDLVRDRAEQYPARQPAPDVRELARRARSLQGRFRSGRRDLAEQHDRHLDDAFAR